MQPERVHASDPRFPTRLKDWPGAGAPGAIDVLGNLSLLAGKTVGLICSVACPGSVIIKTYDAIRELRDAGVTVVGGFHSPMEQECLSLLLRGPQPVVICPARNIEGMRVPLDWKKGLEDRRLLVLSPFTKGRRVNAILAQQRNLFVAVLADVLLIPHASPGGKAEKLCRQMFAASKGIFTAADDQNAHLLAAGVMPLHVPELVLRLGK